MNTINLSNTPILKLKEIEGNMLNSEEVIFSQYGMIGGLRNEKDGSAYFGFNKIRLNKIINDFILNNLDKDDKPDHVFKIEYCRSIQKFQIR